MKKWWRLESYRLSTAGYHQLVDIFRINTSLSRQKSPRPLWFIARARLWSINRDRGLKLSREIERFFFFFIVTQSIELSFPFRIITSFRSLLGKNSRGTGRKRIRIEHGSLDRCITGLINGTVRIFYNILNDRCLRHDQLDKSYRVYLWVSKSGIDTLTT